MKLKFTFVTSNPVFHCAGHYLKQEVSLASNCQLSEPPSTVILRAFKTKSADNVEELTKEVLLPTGEVKLWPEHLKTGTKIENLELKGGQEPVAKKQQNAELGQRNCMPVVCVVAQ